MGLTGAELKERVGLALAAPSLPVDQGWKSRLVQDERRPPVLSPPARLATQPRGVRSPELLEVLGRERMVRRVRRTNQWIERRGARWQSLVAHDDQAPGGGAAGAQWHAS